MQIAAGDIVTIEVMEGQRRKIDLPVSALVDEVIGMSAYMEVDTLNRLTGEGAVVSAAALFVEPSALAALSQRFKQLPVIELVSMKAYTLSSFLDKIAGIVLVSAGHPHGVRGDRRRRRGVQQRANCAAGTRLGACQPARARLYAGRGGANPFRPIPAIEIALAIPIGLLLSKGVVTLIARYGSNETFQIPGVIGPRTYVVAAAIVVAAAAASAYIVRRRVDRLDLVAVLKTRD